MALDPSGILKQTPVGNDAADMFGSYKAGLDIQKTRADIANTNANTDNQIAQNPGIQAQSQSSQAKAIQDQIAAKGAQAVQATTAKFTKVNPDGSMTYDPHGAAMDLFHQGFADQAFNTLNAAFGSASKAAAAQKDSADAIAAQKKVGDDYATTTAQMLKGLNPTDRANVMGHIVDTISSDPLKSAAFQASPLWTLMATNPAKIDAVADGSISPKETKELKISQQNADTSTEATTQNGIVNNSGPAARDPNSPVSRLTVAGPAGQTPGVGPGTSAAAVAHAPGVSDAVNANIVPASVKAAGVQGAAANTQLVNGLTVARNAVAGSTLADNMTVGDWIKQYAKKGNPSAADQALYTQLNSIGDPTLLASGGKAALMAQLDSKITAAKANAQTSAGLATSPTFNQVPSNSGNSPVPRAPVTQPATKALSSGASAPTPYQAPSAPAQSATVRVQAPNGQTGTIPKASLQKYLNQGYKQI